MTNDNTKNRFAEILKAAQQTQIVKSTIKTEDKTVIFEAKAADNTKEKKKVTLNCLTILWNEGRKSYEGTKLITWEAVQKIFLQIWDENERGNLEGGYTKVKVSVLFNEIGDDFVERIDITNGINNGDFNPSNEHIFNYFKQLFESATDNYLLENNSYSTELSNLTVSDILGENNSVNNSIYCSPSILDIPKVAKTDEKTSNICFVNYSERSFAIFGETKQIKEKLKMLGGRFNPFLNYNGSKAAGWIFSKTHEAAVKKSLNIN